MIQIRLESICFRGGDKKEDFSVLTSRKVVPQGEDAREFQSSLVGYYPRIFPENMTLPQDNKDVILLNVPLSGGKRAQCVFFNKMLSRSFWNVLCFSYSPSALPSNAAGALLNDDADVWYDAVCRLNAGDEVLSLPNLSNNQWDGQGIYALSFPAADKEIKRGVYQTEWKSWLPTVASSPNIDRVPLEPPHLSRGLKEKGKACIDKVANDWILKGFSMVIVPLLLIALGQWSYHWQESESLEIVPAYQPHIEKPSFAAIDFNLVKEKILSKFSDRREGESKLVAERDEWKRQISEKDEELRRLSEETRKEEQNQKKLSAAIINCTADSSAWWLFISFVVLFAPFLLVWLVLNIPYILAKTLRGISEYIKSILESIFCLLVIAFFIVGGLSLSLPAWGEEPSIGDDVKAFPQEHIEQKRKLQETLSFYEKEISACRETLDRQKRSIDALKDRNEQAQMGKKCREIILVLLLLNGIVYFLLFIHALWKSGNVCLFIWWIANDDEN